MEKPRTAFVLGGGGRWGAVEVGMLQALDEAGIRRQLDACLVGGKPGFTRDDSTRPVAPAAEAGAGS